jgi:DNA-binding NtrC family response regulator
MEGAVTKPRTLLVVDDDTAMRQMLASLFQEHGYEVRQSSSADEALGEAGRVEFDAILSDIRMPGKTGIEMVGELRRIRPETPVVLMTAFGSIDSAVEAMRAGAFDNITKPFEPDVGHAPLARLLVDRRHTYRTLRKRRLKFLCLSDSLRPVTGADTTWWDSGSRGGSQDAISADASGVPGPISG